MIRAYQPADLDDVLSVWSRASELAHPFLGEAFASAERENIATVYIPNAETWVWEQSGRVVGFIALLGNEVGGLFVDPDFHGTGVGRALMDHARARRGPLEVEVFTSNVIGRAFYAKYGFTLMHQMTHAETGLAIMRLHLSNGPRPAPSDPACANFVRFILLGNAGAGKSTMARRLIGRSRIPRLSLDEIAWGVGTARRPLSESLEQLGRFLADNDQWIVEGCYSDLVEAALPNCTELHFLNPGVDVCVEHCRRRPWEPGKFGSAAEQNAMLDQLIAWVREYDTRDDEYGLKRHRKIFDDFTGAKREYASVAAYNEGHRAA